MVDHAPDWSSSRAKAKLILPADVSGLDTHYYTSSRTPFQFKNIFEIVVQPFPGPGGKFQISTNGGAQPRWNKSGKEIFYVSLDSNMMAAPVKLSPDGQSLEVGTPVTLFPVRIAGGPLPGNAKQQYVVSSDGQRFLVNLAAEEAASPITVILNWKPKR